MIRKIDWELPIPYAIVQWHDDKLFNKDKSEIIIFSNKKAYENFLKEIEQDQKWTGRTIDTIFESKKWYKMTYLKYEE